MPESWEMVDEFSELKPITLYGVTKLFDEDLGRYCALTTPVSVIHLRVSNCTPRLTGPFRDGLRPTGTATRICSS